MKKTIEVDIVIVGAGIAGLWLLNRVCQMGYSAILLESHTLGGGQTRMSQGIIHGGMKYALQGVLTSATQAIADMPTFWQACLDGRGAIDLSHVPVLSKHQYLWTTGGLASKLAGFFSSLVLKGNVKALSKENYPEIFQQAEFKGQVYALEEIVIDVNTLVRELAKPFQKNIFKIEPLKEDQLNFDEKNYLTSISIPENAADSIELKAQRFVFTAGKGNAILYDKLSLPEIKMQRRPLQMVLIKTHYDYPVYAHCLGIGATPRLTITTHKAHDGKTIWYLGGQIAEEGVTRTSAEQITVVKQELKTLFPWLDFSTAEFATFFVDRAEAMQPDGKRPDTSSVKNLENIIVAWPTKLALAPKLAEEILNLIQQEGIKPHIKTTQILPDWPTPEFTKSIWDELL